MRIPLANFENASIEEGSSAFRTPRRRTMTPPVLYCGGRVRALAGRDGTENVLSIETSEPRVSPAPHRLAGRGLEG
jgi:hypothetical protein